MSQNMLKGYNEEIQVQEMTISTVFRGSLLVEAASIYIKNCRFLRVVPQELS